MRIILLILLFFVAATAIPCGILLISDPQGAIMQLSPGLLRYTVFNDFLIPGIVLALLVGGVNLLAFLSVVKNYGHSFYLAIAGGCMIGGWIIIQMMLIRTFDWLQFVYLSTALLILLLSLLLKLQSRSAAKA